MTLPVLAPVGGAVVAMTQVPDPVFAGALMGPGLAVDPARDGPCRAVAPVSGTVVKLHPHAFVIRTRDGAAVLVHLGIGTVRLGGVGFRVLRGESSVVAAGEPVIGWNPAAVAASGRPAICPVVALDAPTSAVSMPESPGEIAVGDVLFVWARDGV